MKVGAYWGNIWRLDNRGGSIWTGSNTRCRGRAILVILRAGFSIASDQSFLYSCTHKHMVACTTCFAYSIAHAILQGNGVGAHSGNFYSDGKWRRKRDKTRRCARSLQGRSVQCACRQFGSMPAARMHLSMLTDCGAFSKGRWRALFYIPCPAQRKVQVTLDTFANAR